MVELELYLDKTIEQSAGLYFERAKKRKGKLEGAKAALEKTRRELAQVYLKKEEQEKKLEEQKSSKLEKREWYEKFRWFISSEGFLCIGGRDSTSNEIIVKKHAEEGDLVFHTRMKGSPFFVIKVASNPGVEIGEATLEEVAQAVASYGKAWKLGMPGLDVFYVKPEQLSKSAPSGEYLTKGAFVVKGSMTMMTARLELAIGMSKEGRIIGGPVSAVKKHADKYLILSQGRDSPGSIAKLVQKKLGGGQLDDIIKYIPSGGAKAK